MIQSIIYFIIGNLIGLGVLLGLAYLFGGSLGNTLNQLLGRLVWTVGSLTNGGTCIILDASGKGYKTVPLRENVDGWEIYDVGKWESVQNAEHLQRVGLRPFGVLLRPDQGVYEDLIFKGIVGEKYDGESYKTEKRGGYAGFMPALIWENRKTGYLISLSQLMNRLKLAGSTEISESAYVESLKKYASLDNLGGTTTQILFYLSALCIGCFSAWLMVG